MHSGKEVRMKTDKLQKKILIVLLALCLITPVGIMLPSYFNAGDAWGEWSASTVKDLVGYVPEGLTKYTGIWKSPMTDYTLNSNDQSAVHKSGFYIVSGIFGATIAYVVMIVISRLIIRNEK